MKWNIYNSSLSRTYLNFHCSQHEEIPSSQQNTCVHSQVWFNINIDEPNTFCVAVAIMFDTYKYAMSTNITIYYRIRTYDVKFYYIAKESAIDASVNKSKNIVRSLGLVVMSSSYRTLHIWNTKPEIYFFCMYEVR